MRFDSIQEGKIKEDRWGWNTFERESDGTTLKLKLYKPTATERLRVLSRFKITGNKPKWGDYMKHIARTWFLEFKGTPPPTDADGKELENSEMVRFLMLNSDEELLMFVQEVFMAGAKELEEGNVVSASV